MRDHIIRLVEKYVGGRMRPSGDSFLMMECPIHGSKSGSPFSVNVDLGLFHCFSCHVAGPIQYLLRLMGVPESVIEVETKDLQIAQAENRKRLDIKKQAEWYFNDPFATKTPISPVVLAPYGWLPTPLIEDGFTWPVLQAMKIGVDLVNERITYPVFDLYGNLAGVVGGRIKPWQEPKYKVYEGRRQDVTGRTLESDFGTWFHERYPDYKFRNHDYLWNYDKVYPRLFFGKEQGTLIIVEGFKACLWLLQCGYWNTVAIMGSKLSFRQKQLLSRISANLIILTDNDLAGREGAEQDGKQLYEARPGVKIARYPRDMWGCQPDDLSAELLAQVLTGAVPYPEYTKEHFT